MNAETIKAELLKKFHFAGREVLNAPAACDDVEHANHPRCCSSSPDPLLVEAERSGLAERQLNEQWRWYLTFDPSHAK